VLIVIASHEASKINICQPPARIVGFCAAIRLFVQDAVIVQSPPLGRGEVEQATGLRKAMIL
jgi:hypothetical protein